MYTVHSYVLWETSFAEYFLNSYQSVDLFEPKNVVLFYLDYQIFRISFAASLQNLSETLSFLHILSRLWSVE